ncbi:hypothetical protein BDN70DRAFT_932634 [Pholiota conissans]|uniref:Uncharacterized protein n=1 Tax=Pholiota conissans TaxID=109636 RepID=A0A9P5Z3U6_9AGAR|nr:hypothetical protein BDN70DRAFT_932634 [Pholiota conissans]
MHMARKDVKEAIKKLELHSEWDQKSDCTIILEFLETLPNLQAFEYRQWDPLIRTADHFRLMSSLRHTSLLELFFKPGGFYSVVERSRPIGLTGLKKLDIRWNIGDNPNEAGSSLAHLYELLRPSLATLVELRIDVDPQYLLPDLDLQLLAPAGGSLRIFEYSLQHRDESILDTIPVIFPHLTKLTIQWSNMYRYNEYPDVYSVLWKESHIETLSKNVNLIDLTLSSDFEMDANDSFKADSDYAWWVRCYKRRLSATQAVALACPFLQRCNWVQIGIRHHNESMVHPFIIEKQITYGNMIRVVRGLKQDWMGREWSGCRYLNGMFTQAVNCKLEALPGDIIGENDPESDDE